MAHLQLTDAEKPGFGPVYYAYCNAIEYLEVEYAQIVLLLENYRLDHDNLKAQVFYKRMLRNDYLLARVRKQFFKKFCTVIPSAQASEFMRLDHSLRSAFRNSIQKDTSFTMKPRGSLFSTNKQRSFP